jgi:hypothetical protein
MFRAYSFFDILRIEFTIVSYDFETTTEDDEGTMKTWTRMALATLALVCLAPSSAAAQGTGGGIGVGANATTAGDAFGIAVPIDVGTSLRLEPGLFFGYERSNVEGTNGGSQTNASTTFGLRAGIHSFFAQSGPARAFVGGDLTYFYFNESQTLEIEVGSVTNTTESDSSGNGFALAPVIGGEVNVAGGLFVGLRAGPQFAIAFPEIDDDNVESASTFSINGYGRVDVIYYF